MMGHRMLTFLRAAWWFKALKAFDACLNSRALYALVNRERALTTGAFHIIDNGI